jgi:DNA helicase II / ATP-dependent DNA helicase PcrA
MLDNNLIDNLNASQREAVESPPGPLLIIAGAGSGKTRVLTFRIAHFIATGINPQNILAITFTNKAAQEMNSRVASLLSRHPPQRDERSLNRWSDRETSEAMPFIGTFHALALRMLREDATLLGISKSFSIADASDSLSIMKRLCKQKKIDADLLPPSVALARISEEKNELRGPDDMKIESETDELIAGLYRDYQATLANESLLDFDDLLFFAVKLLRPTDILAKYQNRFRHILVDEYQDTNTAQYMMVKLLAGARQSVTAVGDDYQAIYGWRGADYQNILDFQKDYPDAKIVKLETNYRSTQKILDAADAIIKKVSARTDKTLVAAKKEGLPVVISEFSDEEEEALRIIEEMLSLRKNGISLGAMTVLYRTNAQSRAFEELLLRLRIPYRIVGGLRFYERREVKDILAFLRYIRNDQDRTSLERIVNIPPRGIGKIGLKKICDTGLEEASRVSKPAGEFYRQIESLRAKQSTMALSKLIVATLDAVQYKQYLRSAFASSRTGSPDSSDERWENLSELTRAASRYDTLAPSEALERFLEDIALFTGADDIDTSTDILNLMTMHLSKGLEFRAVFIAGCEEGLMPHARSMGNAEALDEERRLCYVAITRAKELVRLSCVRRRYLNGERVSRIPSRFLADIPEHLVEFRGKQHEENDFDLVDDWE